MTPIAAAVATCSRIICPPAGLCTRNNAARVVGRFQGSATIPRIAKTIQTGFSESLLRCVIGSTVQKSFDRLDSGRKIERKLVSFSISWNTHDANAHAL
jgi:hypothetical protein